MNNNNYQRRRAANNQKKIKINGQEYNLTKNLPSGTTKPHLVIGLDFDDTVGEFTQCICDRLKEKFNKEFSYEDVRWGFTHLSEEEAKYARTFFNDPNFFSSLHLKDGAKEFVSELVRRGHDIVFVTAAYTGCMTIRGEQIIGNFADIPACNICITGRKDLVKLDILIDDCLKNIQSSIADVPVCVNAPWNKGVNGLIRVDGFKDYLAVIDLVEKGYLKQDILKLEEPVVQAERPLVVSIVGPSGSGKTAIVTELLKNNNFSRVITNTTRNKRPNEENCAYNFVSIKDFFNDLNDEKYLEYSKYADNYYGTSFEEIEKVLTGGKNALIVVDINGATAIKEAYPDNSVTLFVKRKKKDIIFSILSRDVPEAEKVNRLLQLEEDFKALPSCDYIINNDGSLEESVAQILKIV